MEQGRFVVHFNGGKIEENIDRAAKIFDLPVLSVLEREREEHKPPALRQSF